MEGLFGNTNCIHYISQPFHNVGYNQGINVFV